MENPDSPAVLTAVNGSGRNPDGTFAVGNSAARGRTSKPAELRQALEDAITADDIAALAKSLLTQARAGDTTSAKLLLDRLTTKVTAEDEIKRRLAAWKAKFLDELLYRANLQHARDRLVGASSSPDQQKADLLDLISTIDAFREPA